MLFTLIYLKWHPIALFNWETYNKICFPIWSQFNIQNSLPIGKHYLPELLSTVFWVAHAKKKDQYFVWNCQSAQWVAVGQEGNEARFRESLAIDLDIERSTLLLLHTINYTILLYHLISSIPSTFLWISRHRSRHGKK